MHSFGELVVVILAGEEKAAHLCRERLWELSVSSVILLVLTRWSALPVHLPLQLKPLTSIGTLDKS